MKKVIAGIAVICAALRLATFAGASEAVTAWVREVTSDGSFIAATLNLEFGTAQAPADEGSDDMPERASEPANAQEPVEYFQTVPVTKTQEQSPTPVEATAEIVPITISSDLSLRNDTSIDIDLGTLAAEGLSLTLSADAPQILIIHTHASEAYAQTPDDPYEESDPSRTEDTRQNIVRVGEELASALEEYGLNVIHDRGIYDFPSYTGSYSRSGAAIEAYLAQYPSIAIVIDLHRDAIGSGDIVYKTMAALPGESSAQIMLLVGTGENGLAHPQWRENLKLALYLQDAMDSRFPSLARPIALKPERYNQHLTTGSLIFEVGSTGNTLQEALCAVNLFAQSAGPALAELIAE